MIYLALLFAFISTCQGLINGNINCSLSTNYTDLENYNACKEINYNSTQRIVKYGVDCCIVEARYNMRNFSKIARKIKFDNFTVSYSVEML